MLKPGWTTNGYPDENEEDSNDDGWGPRKESSQSSSMFNDDEEDCTGDGWGGSQH